MGKSAVFQNRKVAGDGCSAKQLPTHSSKTKNTP